MARPVRIQPEFHDRVWGVKDLSPWFPALTPGEPVGEAWFRAACPTLVKFLFTSDRLSVQVHPGDEYARRKHGSPGKTEAWYVAGAEPGAAVALGLKQAVSLPEARRAIESGEIVNLLDWRPARAGDTFLVPAGTIHAIGPGLRIIEVQQQSDITYRLYDYDRKPPRELHLEDGLAVADLAPYSPPRGAGVISSNRCRLAACEYFRLERRKLPSARTCDPLRETLVLISLSASGAIDGDPFGPGEVWLLPKGAGAFPLESNEGEVLLTYCSDHDTGALGD